MNIRAQKLLLLISVLTLGLTVLPSPGWGAAKPDDDSDTPKKTEKKSTPKKKKTDDEDEKPAPKKKTAKPTDSEKPSEKEKPKPKPSDDKPAEKKKDAKKSDKESPKDVTDQKSSRAKNGETSKDSKTVEGKADGEFEHDMPGKTEKSSKESEPPKKDTGRSSSSSSNLAGWEITHTQDRDYVTAASIHKFYRFADYKVDGNNVQFLSPVLIMKGTVGSQDLLINNIKFVLSYPLLESNGKVLISRLDLCKLIDPVLRPSYIGSSNTFDTVIIDPGHGGHDSGARGIYGYEKDFALQLGLQLKADLEKRGMKVKMTRSDDTFISLGGRVEIANKVPNSIFVALHFNSGGSSATGIETYALSPQGSSSVYGARDVDALSFHGNQRDSENIALATAVHASVVHHFKMVDRGVKRARWYVLTGLERPGILFEGGFVTNPNDGRLIAAANFRSELAHTIGDAIMNYRRALKPSSAPSR